MTDSTQPPVLRFASPLKAKANILDRAQGITEQIVNVTGHKDSQGDTIMPGAFAYLDNPKPKGVWHHDWKAWIAKTVVADELKPSSPALRMLAPDLYDKGLGGLYIKAQYNLDTQAGRDALSNVEFFGDEAEYSIGYDVLEMEPDGDKENPGWLLKAVPVWEWSPVLFGANELTRTLALKSGEVPDASLVRSVLVNGLKRSDAAPESPAPVEEPAVTDPAEKAYRDLGTGVEGSNEQLRADLTDALYGKFPDADWISLQATLPDSVTFCVWPMDWDAEPDVYQLAYSQGTDGVELAEGDPTPVRLETVIVPKHSPRGIARKVLDETASMLDTVRWRVHPDELGKAIDVEEAAREKAAKNRAPVDTLKLLTSAMDV
jgi:HK97 family phage prohead protease